MPTPGSKSANTLYQKGGHLVCRLVFLDFLSLNGGA